MANIDDASRPQRERPKKAPGSCTNKRLACPFHRNSPHKHRKHRSCAGPGWTTVHRVKEHILRQHEQPTYCMRCSTLFTTETELSEHVRLPASCTLRPPTSHPVGFNKQQQRALRKRGRGPAEKQWKEVYKILFPDVPEKLIPSPYYDNSIAELEKRRLRDLDEMETYLRLEVRREVSRRLGQKSLQPPYLLENQAHRQLIEIIESAQADAFQSYRQQGTRPMETPELNTNYQASSSAQLSQTTYGCGLEAAMGAPAFTTMTATTHNGMGQQNEGGSWMESQTPDMSFMNWDLDYGMTECVTL